MQEHAPNEQTVSILLFECLKGGKVEKDQITNKMHFFCAETSKVKANIKQKLL